MNQANPDNPAPQPRSITKMATPKIAMIVGAMVLALLVVSATIDWMPEALGFAPQVDPLFFFIYWVSVFFTLLIAGTLVFFLLYYRQTDKADAAPGKVTHSTALELTWTIIPVFIVLAIFAYGFKGYMNMAVAPTGSYEIVVIARQWGWQFQYPNGYLDDNLHVPANEDVRLILQSNDVIHSLYIPQLRAKKDVVPGRYNTMWFNAEWDAENPDPEVKLVTLGEGDDAPVVMRLDLYCTEYCGQSHSQMNRDVFVHRTMDDFEAWLEEASFIPGRFVPVEHGKNIWRSQCATCHSIDGSSGTGPTWENIWGREEPLVGGGTWKDRYDSFEQYVSASVKTPQKDIVVSHQANNMSAFPTLKDLDIFAINQYMKSISDGFDEEASWGKYGEERGGDGGAEAQAEAEAEDEAGVGDTAGEPATPQAQE